MTEVLQITALHYCNVVLNSMFCLCICVLILEYCYIGEDFTLSALKTHRYIGNIVISKIVLSGFCPIHFTVTFVGTKRFYCYTGDIVISRIVVSGFYCIRISYYDVQVCT